MINYIGNFNEAEKEYVEEQLDVDAIVIKQSAFFPASSLSDLTKYVDYKLDKKHYKVYRFNRHNLYQIVTPATFIHSLDYEIENKKYFLPSDCIVYIQQGCSENCICTSAYKCKFSVPFEDIKIQIMDLPQDKIISLYGINVGDYNYNDMNIIDLCKKILEYFPNRKIILCNISPFSPILKDLIEYIKIENRILPFIYMCVNSGSQKILDIEGHKNIDNNLVELLKDTNIKIIPYLIVGSPEEDESDFNDTLKWVAAHKSLIFGSVILPYTVNGIGNTNQTILNDEMIKRIMTLCNYIKDNCSSINITDFPNDELLNIIEVSVYGEDHSYYRRYGFACL